MRWRLVALSLGLVAWQVFASTLVTVVFTGIAPRVALAASWLVVATPLLALAPRSSRARLTVAAVVLTLAVDLAMYAAIAYHVPWATPAWWLPRVVALGLASWLAGRVALPRVLRAVPVACAVVGALFVVENARCVVAARGDPARPVETAVVLGFGLLEGGRASPVFVARIERGVDLYRDGLARHLLFTGGVGENPPAESAVALAEARRRGVPDEALWFEDRSHTTRENMTEAARVLRAHGARLDDVAVVSDGFHLARSRRLALDAGLSPVTVAAISPAWTQRRRALWWVLREAMLLTVDDLSLRPVARAWR